MLNLQAPWRRQNKESLRTFFPSTERILFAEHYQRPLQAKGAEFVIKCRELKQQVFKPLMDYFIDARPALQVSVKQINKVTGKKMANHWFGRSQWQLPLKDDYQKLQILFSQRATHIDQLSPLSRTYDDLLSEHKISQIRYQVLVEEYGLLKRPNQGLISKGCSTFDSIGNKYQSGHEDEILVYEFSSNLSMHQNVSFQPIDIRKTIDKASPLLSQSLVSNELLTCEFFFYRTSGNSGLELYYKIKLTDASIVNISCFYPNSITHNEVQPEESLSIRFKSITWEHVTAGTSSYSIWDERIF